MIILGVETSCDETGLAIVEATGGLKNPHIKVLKNLVASQISVHRPFGGVVPNLAKREHIKKLPILWRRIMNHEVRSKENKKSKFSIIHNSLFKIPKLDLIAVTVGPGLEPALWTGINFAKALREKYQVSGIKCQVVGTNHLEGHLYSFLLADKQKTVISKIQSQKSKIFPAVALIVSGGHTILLLMESLAKWKKLGETRDDAVGEAFDKVARMLGLPYPGGPEIEKLARNLYISKFRYIEFPRPMIHEKNYDFSFSGLKTAVLYYLRDLRSSHLGSESKKKTYPLNPSGQTLVANIAASFQTAAFDVLVAKTARAVQEYNAKAIILCGGVAANKALRKQLRVASLKLKVNFFVPPLKYNLDNAAMIAAAGYLAHLRQKKYKLVAQGNLGI